MPTVYAVASARKMIDSQPKGRVSARKVIAATAIAGALFFTSACSASVAASPAGNSSPSESASETATATATPSTPPTSSAIGIVAKGVANNGIGDYLQTSITDGDPAMQYDATIVDEAAKAHFSEAELTEAQRVIVRFISEEAIDSTLNGGTDIDGWLAAHKDLILPGAHEIMLNDLKSGKVILAQDLKLTEPRLTFVHGADTQRVTDRIINLVALQYDEYEGKQVLWLSANIGYKMAIAIDGKRWPKDQATDAELAFAVAKDPADGKWKIGGWDTNYHTQQVVIN